MTIPVNTHANTYLSDLVQDHASDAADRLINADKVSDAIYDVSDAIAAKVNEGDDKARVAFLDRWLSDIGEEIMTAHNAKSAHDTH